MYVHICVHITPHASEPRAERLGWTTYRALRYTNTCTYVCRGSSLLLVITSNAQEGGMENRAIGEDCL